MAFLPLPVNSVPGARSPNPVRVCIASYELLGPSRNGGIGTGYSALAGALAEAGHQVTLLYLFRDRCEDGTISEWEAHYGSRGVQFCPRPTSAHPAEVPQSVGISVDAYRWLSERDFDVIHFPELLGHAYYSVLAKHQGLAFHNTVLCVGVHSPISWIREINGELPMTVDEPEIDFMERESVALADTVVSPSQYLLGWLQSNGWRLPRATYVQQYVLSPELWAAWKDRTETSVPQRVRGLTFFGRLEERKGLGLFCDALDLLVGMNPPLFTVSFLGKSAQIAGRDAIGYIEERASDWPFAWRIIPDRDQQGALAFLRQGGRLAVIPSLVDNLPNAVLECLAARIPFVASRSGGIPEAIAVEDVDRVTFAIDPLALAERLCAALRDGVALAGLAVDPEENRRQWVAWHSRPELGASSEAQVIEMRAADPLVSVCLTQPARPELLRQSLAALQAQSWRNLEIIVAVPGGDSDSETELERIDATAGKKGLRIITRRTGYSKDMRDVTAAHARGDYLLFMDDHTVAKPEQVTTLVEVAEHSGADVLTSFLDLYTGYEPPDEAISLGCRLFLGAAVISGVFRNYYGQGGIFLRKEALLRVGGFATDDWRPCGEWEFLAKGALSGLRLEVVPRALAWYRLDNPAVLNGDGNNGNGNETRRLRPYLQAMPPAFRDLVKLSLTLSRQSDRGSVATSSGPDAALLSEADLLGIVRQRLMMGGNRRIASFLNEWTDYNAVRANLPQRRLQRLSPVVRELFRGNYHRFAHGFGSAFRDLRRAPKSFDTSQDG
ncbi:MAG: glycosyltransferase [Candidatus Binataceae bacterium]